MIYIAPGGFFILVTPPRTYNPSCRQCDTDCCKNVNISAGMLHVTHFPGWKSENSRKFPRLRCSKQKVSVQRMYKKSSTAVMIQQQYFIVVRVVLCCKRAAVATLILVLHRYDTRYKQNQTFFSPTAQDEMVSNLIIHFSGLN